MTDYAEAIAAHYGHDLERGRLGTWGRLEFLRTQELLARFLPAAPATVYDVGGATGVYALPLAKAGYDIHLIDAWPPHIESATAASAEQPQAPLASAAVGDARDLPFDTNSADAVLLLGPMYHLIDAEHRAEALAEARRVLRPGGVLLAAAISRYASTIEGMVKGHIAITEFETMTEDAVRTGIHRNPDPHGRPEWFTLTYFHRPDEFRAEVAAAGFESVEILPIEGPGGYGISAHQLDDPTQREAILRAVRRLESVPELLGATAHLMAVGH